MNTCVCRLCFNVFKRPNYHVFLTINHQCNLTDMNALKFAFIFHQIHLLWGGGLITLYFCLLSALFYVFNTIRFHLNLY